MSNRIGRNTKFWTKGKNVLNKKKQEKITPFFLLLSAAFAGLTRPLDFEQHTTGVRPRNRQIFGYAVSWSTAGHWSMGWHAYLSSVFVITLHSSSKSGVEKSRNTSVECRHRYQMFCVNSKRTVRTQLCLNIVNNK